MDNVIKKPDVRRSILLKIFIAIMLAIGVGGAIASPTTSQAKDWDDIFNIKSWAQSKGREFKAIVTGSLDDFTGDNSLGHAMVARTKGGQWYIAPNYGNSDDNDRNGIMQEGNPLDSSKWAPKKEKAETAKNIKRFLDFKKWGTDVGIIVTYSGNQGGMEYIRHLGRFVGGALLSIGLISQIFVQWFGDAIFKLIEMLNFFKYLDPSTTGSTMGSFPSQTGPLAGLVNPLIDLFNALRSSGYLVAIAMLGFGLVGTALGLKLGKGQTMGSSFKHIISKFLVSMLSLISLGMVLGSLISFTTKTMSDQSGDDDLGAASIGQLIVDYRDFSTSGYRLLPDKDTKSVKKADVEKANTMFNIPVDDLSSQELPTLYFASSQNGSKAANFPSGDKIKTEWISAQQVYAMNRIAGAIGTYNNTNTGDGTHLGNDTSDSGVGNRLDTIMNGRPMELVKGWMSASASNTKDDYSAFGEKSAAVANDGSFVDGNVLHWQASDQSTSRTNTYDYSMPGRGTAPLLFVQVMVVILMVAYFSLQVYIFFLQAIIDMWKSVIPKFIGAAAFGIGTQAILAIAAVIIMFMQIAVGKLTIWLYSVIVTSPAGILNALDKGVWMPTAAIGTNLPIAAGMGIAALQAILTIMLALGMYKALMSLNKTLGATLGEAATRLAMKLAGISEMDPRYQKAMSEARGLGSNSIGNAATGGLVAGATTAAATNGGLFKSAINGMKSAKSVASDSYKQSMTNSMNGGKSVPVGFGKKNPYAATAAAAGLGGATAANTLNGIKKQNKQEKRDSKAKNLAKKGALTAANSKGTKQALVTPEQVNENAARMASMNDADAMKNSAIRDAMQQGAKATDEKGVSNGQKYDQLTEAQQAQEQLMNAQTKQKMLGIAAKNLPNTAEGKAQAQEINRQQSKAALAEKDAQARYDTAKSALGQQGMQLSDKPYEAQTQIADAQKAVANEMKNGTEAKPVSIANADQKANAKKQAQNAGVGATAQQVNQARTGQQMDATQSVGQAQSAQQTNGTQSVGQASGTQAQQARQMDATQSVGQAQSAQQTNGTQSVGQASGTQAQQARQMDATQSVGQAQSAQQTNGTQSVGQAQSAQQANGTQAQQMKDPVKVTYTDGTSAIMDRSQVPTSAQQSNLAQEALQQRNAQQAQGSARQAQTSVNQQPNVHQAQQSATNVQQATQRQANNQQAKISQAQTSVNQQPNIRQSTPRTQQNAGKTNVSQPKVNQAQTSVNQQPNIRQSTPRTQQNAGKTNVSQPKVNQAQTSVNQQPNIRQSTPRTQQTNTQPNVSRKQVSQTTKQGGRINQSAPNVSRQSAPSTSVSGNSMPKTGRVTPNAPKQTVVNNVTQSAPKASKANTTAPRGGRIKTSQPSVNQVTQPQSTSQSTPVNSGVTGLNGRPQSARKGGRI